MGSSLGDRAQRLKNAINMLISGTDGKILALSSIYESPHKGLEPGDSERYPAHLNCVACIETTLSPFALLTLIHNIEEQGGRSHTEHWGPRTIDIDILFYNDDQIDTEELQVPHPGVEKRAFVVIPLAEIAGEMVLPSGMTAAELAGSASIQSQSIKQVAAHELLL